VATFDEKNKELQLYLLNKTCENQLVKLSLAGAKVKGKMHFNSFDESGNEMQQTIRYNRDGFTLPAYSFSKIVFNMK
jgi:hypothetical protein